MIIYLVDCANLPWVGGQNQEVNTKFTWVGFFSQSSLVSPLISLLISLSEKPVGLIWGIISFTAHFHGTSHFTSHFLYYALISNETNMRSKFASRFALISNSWPLNTLETVLMSTLFHCPLQSQSHPCCMQHAPASVSKKLGQSALYMLGPDASAACTVRKERNNVIVLLFCCVARQGIACVNCRLWGCKY